MIDKEGGIFFNKPTLVRGEDISLFAEKSGKIIYKTNAEIGFIDVDTGSNYLRFAHKQGDNLMFSYNEKVHALGIYTGEKVFKIDVIRRETVELGKVPKLKGEDEIITRFRSVNDGFVLSSERNLIKFDLSGNLIYHHYFKQPGMSKFTKKLLRTAGTLAVGAVLKNQIKEVYAAAYDAGLISSDDFWADTEVGATLRYGGLYSAYTLDKYTKRIVTIKEGAKLNSQNFNNYWIVEDTYGLRVLDITTGEESKTIPIDDDKYMNYELMPYFGGLYFLSDNKAYFEKI